MENYDYIIIGTGPSSLTSAYYLAKLNKKILLIGKPNEDSLEFGPTFYSDSNINFKRLLLNFGTNFDSLFRKMKFNSSSILTKSLEYLNIREFLLFIGEFISNTKNKTLQSFMLENNFDEKSINYMSSLCEFFYHTSDCNLNNFLQLVNQELSYNLYQPKEPINKKLFNIWIDNIINTKNCDILLNTEIDKINYTDDKITSIDINNRNIKCENIIVEKYNETPISICFHWDSKLDLQNIEWSTPKSGIIALVLTDYTYFNDSKSVTVISTTILNNKMLSNLNNKILSKKEIINEVFMKLKDVYINLPEPTNIVFNKKDIIFDNISSDNCKQFISIETAICNSINLIHQLEPSTIKTIPILKPDNIIDIIKFFFLVSFILHIFRKIY